MACSKCGGAIDGFKCPACGTQSETEDPGHACGPCEPKCAGCGEAESKCTCEA